MVTKFSSSGIFKLSAVAGAALSVGDEVMATIQVTPSSGVQSFAFAAGTEQLSFFNDFGSPKIGSLGLQLERINGTGTVVTGATNTINASVLGFGTSFRFITNGGSIALLAPGFSIKSTLTGGNAFGGSAESLLNGSRSGILGTAAVSFTGPFAPALVSDTVTGFIGFRNGTASSRVFGWAQISLTFENGALRAGEILGNAIEGDVNQPITVGAIPEPSTVATGLGLLALGAAGLRERRKRKQGPSA